MAIFIILSPSFSYLSPTRPTACPSALLFPPGQAVRCLRELEVPHFHHELVFEVSTVSLLLSVHAWVS